MTMPLYELFNDNVYIQYKNTFFSKAAIFVFVTNLITYILPLVVAYRSRGFWLKNYIFYEQPDVYFKYQYLFIAETSDLNNIIACGNLPNISHFLPIIQDCHEIKVLENDYTYDKKIDEIHFSLRINNPLLREIRTIKLVMVMDYKLHGMCPLQMESLIVHDGEFALPVAEYSVSANLDLIQSHPLPCWHNHKNVQFNNSVISLEPSENFNWLNSILYRYSRRNVSTTLTNVYMVAKRGIVPTIKIDISVAIAEHHIRYRPGLWQELKFSWQQYLSILVIFYLISSKIKSYVFRNNILPIWETIPWKKYF